MTNASIQAHFAFDPLSPDYLREPAPVLKRLQAQDPIFYEPLGCWIVTRYADLREAFRDSASFSSRATGLLRPPEDLASLVPDLSVEEVLIMLDPPEHAIHRNAIAKGFGSAFIGSLSDRIAETANQLIDGFEAVGRVDLMEAYCLPLTMDTIVHALGIPGDRREDYRQWSEDFFALLTPRTPGDQNEHRPVDEADVRSRWTRLAEANAYLRDYLVQLKRKPGNDIISAMLTSTGQDGGPAFSDGAVIRHLLSVIGAGHDTTANSIAHIVHYLSANLDQREELVAKPELIPNVVEEGLRMRGSVPGLFRITTRDVELGGVTLPAGALVYLLTAAAGHDESVFPDSLSFDIHRENTGKHLAFGFGRHNCIGSGLARLQAGIAIRELYRRLPDLAEVSGYRRDYLPLMTVTGLQHLEVSWWSSAGARRAV